MGKNQVEKGNDNSAFEYFSKILNGNELKKAKFNLGKIHFKRKEYKEAIKFFREASLDNNVEAQLWEYLGDCHAKMGDFKEAIKIYTKELSTTSNKKRIQQKIETCLNNQDSTCSIQ